MLVACPKEIQKSNKYLRATKDRSIHPNTFAVRKKEENELVRLLRIVIIIVQEAGRKNNITPALLESGASSSIFSNFKFVQYIQ